MEIKDILKEKGITISKFAEDFRLSRNTAVLYMNQYDKGNKIPKEKYQIVFDRLFNAKNYDRFEYNYLSLKFLIERDDCNGILDLSPNKTDLVMNTFKNFISAMENEMIDDSLLFFINACITSSSNEVIFKTLAQYFYFFNHSTIEDYEKLSDEEKAIYTNYFKVFTMQKRKLLAVDKDIEEMLLSRMMELNTLKKLSKK